MGSVELNQNPLCAYILSKGLIINIFRTAYRIKMKLPGDQERDFQLSKRQSVHATAAINTVATTMSTTTNTTPLLLFSGVVSSKSEGGGSKVGADFPKLSVNNCDN